MKKFSSHLAKLALVMAAFMILASCFTVGGNRISSEAKNFYNLGVAFVNRADFKKAIENFTAAISIQPDYAEAYELRGFSYYLEGELISAISDWEEVLRIDPDYTGIRPNIERARQKLGDSAPLAPAQSSQSAAIPAQASTTLYRVGDTGPAGGLIFYDKGNNSSGWRYLEAAPVEAEFQAQWSVHRTYVDGTQETVGSGRRNTQLIVDKFRQTIGEWDTAAQLCDELEFNGFDDWFLPSKNELDQMYGNLKRRNLGEFKNDSYWSSTTNQCQNFQNGALNNWFGDYRYYVRPVRQVPGP